MPDKETIRLLKMMEQLRKAGENGISIDELCNRLGVCRRTIQSDLKLLRDGSDAEIPVKKDVARLVTDNGVCQQSSEAIVRQAAILMYLMNSKGARTENEIYHHFRDTMEINLQKEKEIWKIRKRVERDLAILIDEGALLFDQDTNEYSLSDNYLPQKFQVSEIDDLIDGIFAETATGVYRDILYGIAEKINRYQSELSKLDTKVMQAGPKKLSDYEKNLKTLFSLNYRTRQIYIDYTSGEGHEVNAVVSLGMIVFLVDEGKIYLICKNTVGKYKYRIIELSRIVSMHNTEDITDEYGKPEYQEICRQMIRVSVGDPIDVKFLRSAENAIEWSQFRENSVVSKRADENTYEIIDTIRGEYDFMKMARRAGNDIVVTAPEEFVKNMKGSAITLIERYEKDYE